MKYQEDLPVIRYWKEERLPEKLSDIPTSTLEEIMEWSESMYIRSDWRGERQFLLDVAKELYSRKKSITPGDKVRFRDGTVVGVVLECSNTNIVLEFPAQNTNFSLDPDIPSTYEVHIKNPNYPLMLEKVSDPEAGS